MGQSWPNIVASNYLYLFVWANLCILFILLFKPSFSNRAETELKWYTGIWENVPLALYHTQTIGASFLLVITYPATVHIVCLSFGYHNQEQCNIWVNKWHSFLQWGTQQENSATKLVNICRNFCNSNAWQSEWGFVLECVDWTAVLNISSEGNERHQLLSIKNKQTRFQKLQGGQKLAIHKVHMYIIG